MSNLAGEGRQLLSVTFSCQLSCLSLAPDAEGGMFLQFGWEAALSRFLSTCLESGVFSQPGQTRFDDREGSITRLLTP